MDEHTIIVGGGIVGISAAYFLARRGARVTVLERDENVDGASTGNAGLVAAGHGPLPRPGLAAKTLRWMFDSSRPLYIPPRPDASLLRWLWDFHRACAPTHYRRSMDLLTEHGHPAAACFRSLVEEESLACEYRPVGQLEIFRTEAGLKGVAEEASAIRAAGYEADMLTGAEIRDREPAVRPDVVGGVLFRDRAFANPGAFLRELTDRAARHGAEIRSGVEVVEVETSPPGDRVTGVRTAGGERLEADTVVLAAGVWSTELARRLGVKIPMQAGKGYHVEITQPEPELRTACVLGEVYVAVTPMDGGLRLAGTLEFSGINHRLREKRLTMLKRGAMRYIAGVEASQPRGSWCGLRPCTADGLPILGWAGSVDRLFIATGHAMMGFALGPLAGRLTCESILDGGTSLDLEPLRVGRFGRVSSARRLPEMAT